MGDVDDICPDCLYPVALHPEFKDGRCPVTWTGMALRKGNKITYAHVGSLHVDFDPPFEVPEDGGYVLKLDPPRLELVGPLLHRATGA